MYANNVSNLDQILSSLQCYAQSSRVRADVYNLLGQIPSLQPNCGTFTHNDGTASTLLDLEGTIPIFYRGSQYNIPVELWVVENYPLSPPVCFVRPTPDMMVKPGHPHVTSNGYVKIPYTSDWRQDFTLLELVAHMCSIFGNIPPVFRRPANMMPQYRGYSESAGAGAARLSASSGPGRPSGFYQSSAQYGNLSASHPPQYSSGSQPSPSRASGRMSESLASSGGRFSERDSESSLFGVPAPSPSRSEDRSQTLKRDITEKLQLKLDKIFTRVRDDIDLQYEHDLQLTQSQENVERGIRSLELLRDDLKRAKATIAAQDEEVTKWLDENEGKDTVDPDSILVEADPLSKQMVQTLAEHHAIEDALYFLDRALSNDEMELSVFLKEVRKLSRKQFMCQALLTKIHETQQQTAVPAYSVPGIRS